MRPTPSARPIVVWLLPSGLLAYAAFAFSVARWWISGLAAPIVAALLWRRHPRARFSAYIFLSVVAIRGVATHRWPVLAFAAAAVGLMQTPGARRAWPRLRRGHTRAGHIC